jgi:hypothetical protein
VELIVTNPETHRRAVVRFYNKLGNHGTADQGRQASGENDAARVGEVVEMSRFSVFVLPNLVGDWR